MSIHSAMFTKSGIVRLNHYVRLAAMKMMFYQLLLDVLSFRLIPLIEFPRKLFCQL